ncbi:MAG: TIGR03915 family putative DNA repair protein [Clostridia bacterium]|nr:TIGR03915 family putative DNA repair protein [Clostridia bacterium]
MTAFIYDGTKIGLFTCVFDCFYERHNPDVISSSPLQVGLQDEIYEIKSDQNKAERVNNCLLKCKTKNLSYDLSLAFRSGEAIKSTIIFKYLKKVIDNKNIDVSKNYADADVLNFNDLIQRILFEAHRMKGFLRFSQTQDGYYYSHYEPDNDVTELLMPHFKDRFHFPFIIHDLKRNILGLCDGKKYKVLNWNKKVEIYLSENEKDLEKLWKTYYKSVNIKERANEKVMLRFMPKRYWKHAIEKNEDTETF